MIPQSSLEIREFILNSLFSKFAKFCECKTLQTKNHTIIELFLGYKNSVTKSNFLVDKQKLVSFLSGKLIDLDRVKPTKIKLHTNYHYSVVLHRSKKIMVHDYQKGIRQPQIIHFLVAAIHIF